MKSSYSYKLAALADDITHFLANLNFLVELLRLLANFNQYSLLKVNFENSDFYGIK